MTRGSPSQVNHSYQGKWFSRLMMARTQSVQGFASLRVKQVCDCRVLPLRLLFDQFRRPFQHIDWNGQTNLLSRLEIDDELKLRRLLDRKIRQFGALQDLVDVNSRAPLKIVVLRLVSIRPPVSTNALSW